MWAAEGSAGPCPVRHGGEGRAELFWILLLVLLLVHWAVGIRSDPKWQFLCIPALWLLDFINLC